MFGGLFGKNKSKDKVKERLQLVLSYDRARLSPGKMEELKDELLQVIAKYFPPEEGREGLEDFDVKLEQHGDRMVLVADLPVQR